MFGIDAACICANGIRRASSTHRCGGDTKAKSVAAGKAAKTRFSSMNQVRILLQKKKKKKKQKKKTNMSVLDKDQEAEKKRNKIEPNFLIKNKPISPLHKTPFPIPAHGINKKP
eukprot:TRINITY_DN503_c0_g3_i3.p2 TRINITY_DN503_c0_g3~~TRINITY_DN503_c0_g3_i3.p2  ORF type:complete len:114 (+),score=9.73 TRINITY_DN503_c0_g3_i3:259-600(+)